MIAVFVLAFVIGGAYCRWQTPQLKISDINVEPLYDYTSETSDIIVKSLNEYTTESVEQSLNEYTVAPRQYGKTFLISRLI